MTVIVKNKLVDDGYTYGYTVCVDGVERRYSSYDAAKLVYKATHTNVIIVRKKDSSLFMNDNDIKARLRHSYLRAKSGRLPIVVVKF